MNDFERSTLITLRTRAQLFVALLDELIELPSSDAPSRPLVVNTPKCPPHPRAALKPAATFGSPHSVTCLACDETIDLDDPNTQVFE